jgi:hypothetical protein
MSSPVSPVCSQQEISFSDDKYWGSTAAGALLNSDEKAMLELDIISADGYESMGSIFSIDEDSSGGSFDFFDESSKVICCKGYIDLIS